MENKFIGVLDKIEKVELSLKQLKAYLNDQHIPVDVPKAIAKSFEIEDLLFGVTDGLQDVEMLNVDFEGINLDASFENNPVSDYVQAGIDYVSGDVEAVGRMMEAVSRITGAVKVSREEDLLNVILEREEAFAIQLDEALLEIEDVLEGTDIDNWSETQLELARYFIQFQPDTSVYEAEMLTPHGVKMVWKRRRYLGAAK